MNVHDASYNQSLRGPTNLLHGNLGKKGKR